MKLHDAFYLPKYPRTPVNQSQRNIVWSAEKKIPIFRIPKIRYDSATFTIKRH